MTQVGNRIATASIVNDDPHAAAQEAIRELTDQLGAPPSIVLVVFSADFSAQAVRDGIYRELPASSVLVGCSSFAELGPDGALTHSVTALGLQLPGYTAKALCTQGGTDSFAIGQQLAEELLQPKPDLILLFPDVLTLNVTRLLRGLQAQLGTDIPILGGAPADNGAFRQTEMICGSQILQSGAVALALFGPLSIHSAACSGYTPVSVPLRATSIEQGNVLLELNGRDALSVYLELLGPRRNEMPAVTIEYPIGVIRRTSGKTEVQTDLVRAVFGIDEHRGALVLGGDIPEQAELCILSATRPDLLSGTNAALQSILSAEKGSGSESDLVLVFNCMSRKVILGPRYKEESAILSSLVAPKIPRFGFYTFGELSPVARTTQHHESTFTVAAIRFHRAT